MADFSLTASPGAVSVGGVAATLWYTTPTTMGRVSQEAVEVVLLPTGSQARVSQEAVEVALSPSNSKARISQEAVEIAVKPTDSRARISQVAVEVLHESAPLARVSQVAVEVLHRKLYEQVQIMVID